MPHYLITDRPLRRKPVALPSNVDVTDFGEYPTNHAILYAGTPEGAIDSLRYRQRFNDNPFSGADTLYIYEIEPTPVATAKHSWTVDLPTSTPEDSPWK